MLPSDEQGVAMLAAGTAGSISVVPSAMKRCRRPLPAGRLFGSTTMSSPLNTHTSRVVYIVDVEGMAPPPSGTRCSSLVLESKERNAAAAKVLLYVAIAPLVMIGLPSSTTTCGVGSRMSRH